MAVQCPAPPGVSDKQNFRAGEAFLQAVQALLRLVGRTVVDLGSIAAGGTTSFTVSVLGARADRGQTVQVGLPSTWNAGLVPYGYVSADDVVTVVVRNVTVGAIDPPSATYTVRCMP